MTLRVCLLIAITASVALATIDCSREDSCFGYPQNCNPDLNCTSLFQFERDGSLNLYLRDFENPIGYAAFAVGLHPDETIEYFICVPNERRRFRAIAELGGIVLTLEQNLTGIVEKLSPNYFRCHFNDYEIPYHFRGEQNFFVTRGTYDHEVLVIFDGDQMYNLELDEDWRDEPDYDENAEDEEEPVPIAHFLGIPVDREFTPKQVTLVLDETEEEDATKKRVVRSENWEVDDDEDIMEEELDDDDDDEEEEDEITEEDQSRQENHKPKGRPHRYEQTEDKKNHQNDNVNEDSEEPKKVGKDTMEMF